MNDRQEVLAFAIRVLDESTRSLRVISDEWAAMTRKVHADMQGLMADSAKLDEATASYARQVTAANREVSASGAAAVAAGRSHDQAARAVAGHAGQHTTLAKRISATGQATQNWGRSMSGLSLPMALIGGASLKMAADFDQAMTLLQTQAGASGKSVDELRKKVLDLAPSTGFTPTELAKALFPIESSLTHDPAKALNTLRSATQLAKVGQTDLAQTTDTLTSVLRNNMKGVHDSTDAIAQLNAIVGIGKMHMQDLIGAIGTGLLTRAAQFGLSLKDVGAALDLMTAKGVPARDAATRLGMTFALMGAPRGPAVQALERIHLTQTSLAEAMRGPTGLIGAVDMLQKHLESAFPRSTTPLSFDQQQRALAQFQTQLRAAGMTQAEIKSQSKTFQQELSQYGSAAVQRTQILSQIFGGGRTSAPIMAMIQGLPDMQARRQQLDVLGTAPHFQQALRAQETQEAQQLRELRSQLATVAIVMGHDLLPVVRDVGHDIADLVHAFDELPAPLRHGAEAVMAFLALAGPLAIVGGGLLRGVGSLGAAGGLARTLLLGRVAAGVTTTAETSLVAGGESGVARSGVLGLLTRLGGTGAIAGLGQGGVLSTLGTDLTGGLGGGLLAGAMRAGVWGDIGVGLAKGVITGFHHGISAGAEDALHSITFGLTPAFNDFKKVDEKTVADINRINLTIGDGLRKGVKASDEQLTYLQGAFDRLRNHTSSSLSDLQATINDNVRVIGTTFQRGSQDWADAMNENLRAGMRNVANSLQAGTLSSKQFMEEIDSLASQHFGNVQQSAVSNFNAAKGAIQSAMQSGQITTQQGLSEIDKLFRQYLGAYGIKGHAATLYLHGSDPLTGKPMATSPGSPSRGMASGGIVGAWGERGPDNVLAMLGRGEAVLNADQQQPVDLALRRTYGFGLPQLFSKVNTRHYAGGGYVFPFPSGESYSWQRVDQGQDLQGPPGGPVLALGPGMVTVGHDRFSGFGANYPILTLSDGQLRGKQVYYGHARDTRTGLVAAGDVIGVTQSRANTWTAAPAGWTEVGFFPPGSMSAGAAIAPLLHAIAGDRVSAALIASLGGAGAGLPSAIRAPSVGGPDSPLKAIVQTVLANVTQAANQAVGAAGALPGGGGGNLSGNRALGRQMMLGTPYGWGPNQWPPLDALWTRESGWDANAVNRMSGAMGIPQALGHGNVFPLGAPRPQIAWGLGYIHDRYGSPAAAWAHEQAFGWYGGGGFAGAFGSGGAVTASKPTMALFGERGAETAIFLPHYAGGTPNVQQIVNQGVANALHGHGSAPAAQAHIGYNPLTDKIESHTSAEWARIHAENAKRSHDRAHSHHAARRHAHPSVQEAVTLGGETVGEISGKTSKPIDLNAGVEHIKGAVWQHVVGAILGGLKSLDQAGQGGAARRETHELAQLAHRHPRSTRLRSLASNAVLAQLGIVGSDFTTQQELSQRTLTRADLLARLQGHPEGSYATLFAQGMAEKASLGQYSSEHARLEKLLADAKKTRNQRLVKQVQAELDQVNDAILQSKVDIADIKEQIAKAVHQQFIDAMNTMQQAFEGQSQLAGTSLQLLLQNEHNAGTDDAALQKLKDKQGGYLTADQIAQANSNLNDYISAVGAQESPLKSELSQDEALLTNPQLTADERASLTQHIADLKLQIAQLDGSIKDQTDATKDLTTSTDQNTQVQQQFGNSGTAFQYNSQDYLPGQTPERGADLLVGA